MLREAQHKRTMNKKMNKSVFGKERARVFGRLTKTVFRNAIKHNRSVYGHHLSQSDAFNDRVFL